MLLPRLSILALSLLAPAALTQTTWHVDAGGVPPGTGTSSDPFTSVQAAISQPATLSGDTILVRPGTYEEDVDFLGKTLVLRSSAGRDVTTLRSGSLGTVVRAVSGEGPGTAIEGFTLRDGGGWPTAVEVNASSLSIDACLVLQNGASYDLTVGITDANVSISNTDFRENGGGVIRSGRSTLVLDRVLIEDGLQSFGAGLWMGDSDVTITDSAFRGCRAYGGPFGEGGAIYVTGGAAPSRLIVERSVFEDNYAYDLGGAISVGGGAEQVIDVTMRDCTVTGCTADFGAGALAWNGGAGTVLLEGCTIAGNGPSGVFGATDGGAAWNGRPARYVGCTFVGNEGRSILNSLPGTVFERCTLARNAVAHPSEPLRIALGGEYRDCILYDNTATTLETDPSNVTYSNVEGGFPGVGNIDVDPQFVHPVVGDFRLRPLSPCIDAGDPSSPLDADGTRADMGALPYDQSVPCPSPEPYCEPKLHSGGCFARMGWSGTPDLSGADDFHVTADSVLENKFGIAFLSREPRNAPLFGGLRCTGGMTLRTAPVFSGSSGSSCSGTFDIALDQSFLTSWGVSELLHVQFLFRDPGGAPGEQVSMTDGLRVVVCP